MLTIGNEGSDRSPADETRPTDGFRAAAAFVGPPPAAPTAVEVPAGLVVRREPDDGTGLARYTIYHIATGMRLTGPAGDRCAVHVDQAIAIIAATDIDWTHPAPHVMRHTDCGALYRQLREGLGLCFDPEPPTAVARPCAGDRPGMTPASYKEAA